MINVGDVVRFTGVSSEVIHQGYNTLYRITSVATGNDKQFNATSASTICKWSSSEGVGSVLTTGAFRISDWTIYRSQQSCI